MRTSINIEIDRETGIYAREIATGRGISLGVLVNTYLKKLIKSKEACFTLPYKMSLRLEKYLSRIEKDIQKNKNISGVFSSAKDLKKYLHDEN
ncbi:MAG: hypothetical protein AAB693_01515 [Patescibacteria group bacterium]